MTTARVRSSLGHTPAGPASAPVAAPPLSPAELAVRKAQARPWALASLACAIVAIALICFGDPYWLALPAGAFAMLIGHRVHKRLTDQLAISHVGVNLGLLAVSLWLIIDVVLGRLNGLEFNLLYFFR